MPTVDLNADLGEGSEFDSQLMAIISSCNVACGGHSGDAASMTATVRRAAQNKVALGAHPSYPDRSGFGRRSGFLAGQDLLESLVKQIVTLKQIATGEGAELVHVKPHGALYNDAADSRELADIVVQAAQTASPGAALLGPPASELQQAAAARQLNFIAEAFVDRAYLPSGRLVPRGEANAVHADINTMTAQALGLAIDGTVTAQNGEVIEVRADTLCLHSDTPNAGMIAQAVRDVLEQHGVIIRAAH